MLFLQINLRLPSRDWDWCIAKLSFSMRFENCYFTPLLDGSTNNNVKNTHVNAVE